MQVAEVEQVVYESLAIFGIEREEMQRTATLVDLGLESLDLLELGAIVGEKFDVTLETKDFVDAQTLGDAMDIIVGRVVD